MALNLRSKIVQNVFRPFQGDRFAKVRQIFRTIDNFETPTRLKGTFIEKWGIFWKQLYLDYKDVVIDVGKEFKERPLKSCFYVSLMGSGVYLAKHNPDATSFRDALLKSLSDMTMVGDPVRNPQSLQHILWLNECYAQGIVRHLSIGIMSFIWLDNYREGLALYKAICPYLKPRYLTFHERIIDVGIFDNWWNLRNKMIDYDINEAEFITTSQTVSD